MFAPLARIEASQMTHHPQLRATSVLIDAALIVVYHSAMSDQHDNQQHNPASDALPIGELITMQEAAEYSGLSKHSLQTYIRLGKMVGIKRGWMWFTTHQAVDDYLKSRHLENIPKKYRKDA